MNITLKAVYVVIFSWHNVCGQDCNQNNNPPAGVDFSYNGSNYTAVAYPNSHSKGSLILAKREKYYFYGAVAGYAPLPIPFIAPVVTLGPVDVSCLSDFAELWSDSKTKTVCMTNIKYRF